MQDPSRFLPYVKSGDAKIGQDDQGLADNNDWGALYLWDHSQLVAENAALFPHTLKALEMAIDVPAYPKQYYGFGRKEMDALGL